MSTPANPTRPTEPHRIRRFGWIPDLPDHRDLLFAAPSPIQKDVPSKADLTPLCPPVYDQGDLGSCTANAIAGAIEFDLLKQKLKDFIPSRLFIYYNERVIENTVASDSGAQIRDGIKSVASLGVCSESEWPYDISKFVDKPSAPSFAAAATHKVVLYQRLIQDLNTMKGCIASGYPFVFGFTVYAEFENAQVAASGVVPMPKARERALGGHAVMAVGYDDDTEQFTVRNSWGSSWALKGYFKMPYAYLLNHRLASDFWTIRTVQ
jgi:C1A family cysteine protease